MKLHPSFFDISLQVSKLKVAKLKIKVTWSHLDYFLAHDICYICYWYTSFLHSNVHFKAIWFSASFSCWHFQDMRRSRVQDLTKLGSVSEMVWYRVSSNHAKPYAFIIFLNWTIAARLLRGNRNQSWSVALTSTIDLFPLPLGRCTAEDYSSRSIMRNIA